MFPAREHHKEMYQSSEQKVDFAKKLLAMFPPKADVQYQTGDIPGSFQDLS